MASAAILHRFRRLGKLLRPRARYIMPFLKPASLMPSPFFNSVAAGSKADGKVMGQGPFGAKYYLSGALAGGICCSITHGALTPVDVVKTRIQLDPVKYNQGFIGGFKQVIADEGAGALLTGLGPTAQVPHALLPAQV